MPVNVSFCYLQGLYEVEDIKWLSRNMPEHVQDRGERPKVFHRKVLEVMLGAGF